MTADFAAKTASDNAKSEFIKKLENDHAQEIANIVNDGKRTSQKELTDRKAFDAKIKQLERELSEVSRKLAITEADKLAITEELDRHKTVDVWTRKTPSKIAHGIGKLN